MPGTFDGMTTNDLRKVQQQIAGSEWKRSPRSPSWAGYAVAEVLNLDPENQSLRKRITTMLAGRSKSSFDPEKTGTRVSSSRWENGQTNREPCGKYAPT
jgi:hypothetical protein